MSKTDDVNEYEGKKTINLVVGIYGQPLSNSDKIKDLVN